MTKTRRRLRPVAALTSVGAFLALIVSVTALVDWVGKKTTKAGPAQIDARIVSARAENYAVPLSEYLRNNGRRTGGLTARQAREKGMIFSVRVRLRGNLGKRIPLRWWMFERDGNPLPRRLYSQTAGQFEPRAQDHSRTVELWIPYPPRPGRYFVRFSLLDDKREPFDIKNAPFVVTRVPEPR